MNCHLGGHMRRTMFHGAAALATLALVLTSAPDARAAAVLTTPSAPANNGQVPACLVNNIDKKPITVTVQLFDSNSGMPLSPSFDSCPVSPATLAPGAGCGVQLAPNDSSYCVVTASSSKARAVLVLFNGTTHAAEVAVPATK
jgi:hypothetical protein